MGGDGGVGKLEEGGPVNKNTVEEKKTISLSWEECLERQDPRVEMATSCININLPEANT